jgi:hypothetical protein
MNSPDKLVNYALPGNCRSTLNSNKERMLNICLIFLKQSRRRQTTWQELN